MILKISIERGENGWICEFEDYEGEEPRHCKQLFEIREPDGFGMSREGVEGLEAWLDVLRLISDYFGMRGSRRDKKRLHICTKPSDKYEKPSQTQT